MPIATDAAFILPDDFAGAALMGRIWRPDLAGPSVVAIRQDGVFDSPTNFPPPASLPPPPIRPGRCAPRVASG